jgi:hypothetical protein
MKILNLTSTVIELKIEGLVVVQRLYFELYYGTC